MASPEAAPAASKLSIILSKGSLDMAYPAFILASTAAAMGREVHVFFTFWGLSVIDRRHRGKLKVSAIGNPALPMPSLVGTLPGMAALTTQMMKSKMKNVKIPSIPDMMGEAKAAGVHFHACTTTMDVMGVAQENLVEEVEDVLGAASFLEMSEGAQIIFI
jgi:peroxiredoxin family protein